MKFCFSVYDMNGDGFIGRWDRDPMNMAVPESSLQGGDGDPAEGEFDYCSERQLH